MVIATHAQELRISFGGTLVGKYKVLSHILKAVAIHSCHAQWQKFWRDFGGKYKVFWRYFTVARE